MTGPELKAALRRIGMSQREFAQRIAYRQETVSRYVRGHDEIPAVVRVAVEGLLNGPVIPRGISSTNGADNEQSG